MATTFEIQRVGVIGCGQMGLGIARASALAGYPTVLVKATARALGEATAAVDRAFASAVKKGKVEASAAKVARARMTITADRDQLGDCDLVVESIVEDLELKRRLFADVLPRLKSAAVLATNTSTLKLVDLVPTGWDDRFVGLHFFSPVAAMKLVELAHLPTTSPDVLSATTAFASSLNKTVIPLGDSAGLIVNRLIVPYLVNAIDGLASGLATVDQIDSAMKLGCAHPMGPLALCDLIGLDVVFAMSKVLYREFADSRYRPPALLRRLVQDGRTGRKGGRGFYDYTTKPAIANPEIADLVSGRSLQAA